MEQDRLSTKLMLLKGKTADQARLCWSSELSFVRREQCLVWKVPAG
ncbi:MAG: hypothetical protein Q4A16_01375 [Lautropia sp.]|nr:hypothetical protein [Lautropia sp.]